MISEANQDLVEMEDVDRHNSQSVEHYCFLIRTERSKYEVVYEETKANNTTSRIWR